MEKLITDLTTGVPKPLVEVTTLGRTLKKRELPGHGVADSTLATASAAPLVGLDHAAGDDCAGGFKALTDSFEAEFVESAETWSGQGRRSPPAR